MPASVVIVFQDLDDAAASLNLNITYSLVKRAGQVCTATCRVRGIVWSVELDPSNIDNCYNDNYGEKLFHGHTISLLYIIG
jgi:hypothetical protein